MNNIDSQAERCLNRRVMTNRPILSDEVVSDLLKLPNLPARPLIGKDFARVLFPHRIGIFRWLWSAVPRSHKNEDMRVISPEAFNIIYRELERNGLKYE